MSHQNQTNNPMYSRLLALALATLFLSTLNGPVSGSARKPKELSSGQNCTNHLQTIDRCSSLATYSYTTSFNQYPQNAAEMKTSCDRISDGLKCLKTYGKCLSALSRRSLTSYSNSRSRHSKRLCSDLTDQKAVEFWSAAECIKNKNRRNTMVAYEQKLISTIQLLSTNATMKWEDRFHYACCSVSTYKADVIKVMESDCAKYKTTIEDMIDSMVGELLESACPDQSKLQETCQKLSKLTLDKNWKAVSLTGAALDLIIKLSDDPKS